jgi:hypothetical protein
MRHSLLFLFLIFLGLEACLVYGQQPLYQFGGAESDSWDAIAPIPRTASAVFALGYQRETRIQDSAFLAPDRGLVLASMTETQVEIWGNMYSRGNTQIHDLVPVGDSVFVFGNAFSYLVYRGDTLIPNNGRNSAFILCLDAAGNVLQQHFFNSRGAVLGQAAVWQANEGELVTLLQIRDSLLVDQQLFVPQAETASLLLHWSPDLELMWSRLIDGSGEIEGNHLRSVDDELYVAGRFKGEIQVQSDAIATTTAGFDGFVFSTLADGSERFIRHLKGQFEDDIFTLDVNEEAVYFGGQFIGNLALQNLEIVAGLQVAGYVGAMDRDGEALWLHPVRGSSITLAVSNIKSLEDHIQFIIWTGRQTSFQGDTLEQPTAVGQLHSIVARIDRNGQKTDWHLWPGDEILFLRQFIALGTKRFITAEMQGRFAGHVSRGFFDALLIDPSVSTFSPSPSISPSQMTLFPQPAGRKLCFDAPFSPPYSYTIYNLQGVPIARGTTVDDCLSIAPFPVGSYVLQLISQDGQDTISKLWIKGK